MKSFILTLLFSFFYIQADTTFYMNPSLYTIEMTWKGDSYVIRAKAGDTTILDSGFLFRDHPSYTFVSKTFFLWEGGVTEPRLVPPPYIMGNLLGEPQCGGTWALQPFPPWFRSRPTGSWKKACMYKSNIVLPPRPTPPVSIRQRLFHFNPQTKTLNILGRYRK